jgi:hypothetical protein
MTMLEVDLDWADRHKQSTSSEEQDEVEHGIFASLAQHLREWRCQSNKRRGRGLCTHTFLVHGLLVAGAAIIAA